MRQDARALMAKINKKFGEGSIVVASAMPAVPRFPSGSLSLDVMLGGGWPGNQWVEIVGAESSGKTTVAHKTVAENQKADPEFVTLWVAAEGYDEDWAHTLGVDTDRVIVHSTNGMEEAYTVMLEAAASRAVDAVILDSYPALVADAEDEKDMDESTMAAGARVTGKFFRKAGAGTRRSLVQEERPFLGIIINQWRDQIGGFSPNGATPKTSPGGRAKNYAYGVRLEVSRTEWIDEKRPPKGMARVGQVIKLRTIKNKAASPQQVASIKFLFADAPSLGLRKGDYDIATEMVLMGILYDVITLVGDSKSWISYRDEKWNGKEKMAASIISSPELQAALRVDILAAAGAA